MRILIVHSRYLSGDASGENRVVLDESRLLADAGHEVTTWAPTPDAKGPASAVHLASNAIWAGGLARRIGRFIRERGIDVVHVHNLFPLVSPASLRAAAGAGAAVVMTLHNYRLICVSATLMRDGRPCQDCVGRTPWPGVVHGCYRSSTAASATIAASLALHRSIGSFDVVDRFLAVSRTVARHHTHLRSLEGRLDVKENFAWPTPDRDVKGSTFLYVGRLAREKGVDTLIRAWSKRPGLGRLVVVGDGPERLRLEASAPESVEFAGSIPQAEVARMLLRARGVAVPSRWEEPAVPKVVLEAYAAGVPVVASATGAITEGVLHGTTGYLVDPQDEQAWADRLHELTDDVVNRELGHGARRLWHERYAPAIALAAIERQYGLAIVAAHGRRKERRRHDR